MRGLVAIVLAIFSRQACFGNYQNRCLDIFGKIGLIEHLSSQRGERGLRSMIRRIKSEAEGALPA